MMFCQCGSGPWKCSLYPRVSLVLVFHLLCVKLNTIKIANYNRTKFYITQCIHISMETLTPQ